jgi:glyoxylase-like metal-dependent hydrolase (beta-lactamase superfamily II)/rhodanese-related sulfurtransferase
VHTSTTDLRVIALETPTLGDRSYLVHDGSVALVVDPQRDIDRVLALLEEHGVRLAAVFETHIHNDYVTGGLALAAATGAVYHVNADDPVRFERTPISDGDVVAVGDRMSVRALATPGHTYTHLSYALYDAQRGDQRSDQRGDQRGGQAVAVFTGGSLLYGATGRPDLLGPDHTHDLVRLQHASAHRLADLLPDDTEVLPTHGFGSFCAATQSEATSSTIGTERRVNPVLTQDLDQYVKELLDGLDVWPAYYVHMAPANLEGPSAPDLSPPSPAHPSELRRRIDAGEWVVDLRTRVAFAAGHVPGSFNFGLDGSFATYLGWLIAWGTPLTLLAETPEEVAEGQRELVRIGIDRVEAAATGTVEEWAPDGRATLQRATFGDLAQVVHHRQVEILDVRRRLEREDAHVIGARHIPLHELPQRLDEIPQGEVWVHCGAGYRASIAASFLAAAGRQVVAVDDEFESAAPSGLPMSRG